MKKYKTYNKLIKIINDKNGKLLSNEYHGVSHKYEYECKYGHKWKTTASSIINNNTWCPECRKKVISNKLRRKDGVDYLNDLAKKNNGNCLSDKYLNNNTKYKWKCKNNHIWEASCKHVSNGTWCPRCKKESKGEKKISQILNKLNIDYIREYTFDDCRGKKRPLPFDFFLPEYNCCIEFDGEQHYLYRENGLFENKLKNIQNNDKIKTEYCKINNISLIRIPYGFLKKIENIINVEYNNKFNNSVDYSKCIVIVAGTRPEEIKTEILLKEFEKKSIPCLYIFTGQHKSLINRKKYDFLYSIGDNNKLNRLDNIVYKNISNFSKLFKNHPYIKYVLVQGDTTSAMSVALCGKNNGKKIIHLEAGLRTYNNDHPYPEEVNRRIISAISDIHLCPTQLNLDNLNNEKIVGDKYVVGNTVLDNLVEYKKDCKYGNKILITLHRRENHHWLDEWFQAVDKLAKDNPEYEFILPIHPNPNVQQHKHILKHVKVVDPMSHTDLIKLLVECKLVISDSGGIQEECSFFNKKCLVCRKYTERPEAVELTSFMVDEPTDLITMFNEHIKYNDFDYDQVSPFGVGNSSETIVDYLINDY